MLMGVPETTAYDLRFRLLGIPARVHPLFWLVSALLGSGKMNEDISLLIVWVACVFVSILVHEFGHALMARFFGARPSVVLYGMGGLCYYDESDRQGPWQRIAVLICGPGAGFLLAGILIGLYLVFNQTELGYLGNVIFEDLLEINIAWGIMNLFPIWPLDGGQITVVGLSMLNRRNGRRWAHVVSLLCGAGLALVMFRLQALWLVFLFGYLAFINYRMLEAIHYSQSHLGGEDSDWWRR
jgi:Zn-dependent protease